MSIIRTKDHSNIIQFFPCNLVTGAGTASEANNIMTDGVAMTAITATGNPKCKGIEFTTGNTSQAFGGAGAPDAPGSKDWALMVLLNFSDPIANGFIMGSTGANSSINIGTISAAVKGDAGSISLATTLTKETEQRLLITFDADGSIKSYTSSFGADLALETTEPASTVGDMNSFTNEFTNTNTTGDGPQLFSWQLITFTDGLPSDIVTKANALFELWEAGNKSHYPILEDE